MKRIDFAQDDPVVLTQDTPWEPVRQSPHIVCEVSYMEPVDLHVKYILNETRTAFPCAAWLDSAAA